MEEETGVRIRASIDHRSTRKRRLHRLPRLEYDQQTVDPLYFTVNVFANNFPENVATVAKESATLGCVRFAYLA